MQTFEDVIADLDFNSYSGPRMKGRRYKARERTNAAWQRDPVLRCDCGRVEARFYEKGYDRLDHDSPQGVCPYGSCVQFYCPTCARIRCGFGPMGCLCESRSGGHMRRAEQPKPRVPKKYRDRRPKALHYWEKENRRNNE